MRFIFESSYVCCCCGKRVREDKAHKVYKKSCICLSCYEKIKQTPKNAYFEGTKYIDFLCSPFYYCEPYRDIFLSFKFNGNFAYGHLIGMMLSDYFYSNITLARYDCIVPVPLSKDRLNQRGYNQSDVFAQYLSSTLGVPVIDALSRCKKGEVQSRLSALDRHMKIRGAFEVTENIDGKKIIVIDDVFTTGSTLNECGAALRECGAEAVCAVTAAYVYKRKDRVVYI